MAPRPVPSVKPEDGSGPERTREYGEGLRVLSVIPTRATRKRIPLREGMLLQAPPCRGPSSVAPELRQLADRSADAACNGLRFMAPAAFEFRFRVWGLGS